MIVCSCSVISDRDIEAAVIDLMALPVAPLPTPGVVFRHLNKKMNCCTCAPIAVAVIYSVMDRLAADTRICPFVLAEARRKLIRFEERRALRQRAIDEARVRALQATSTRAA